jgi:hypothetical protein
MATTADITFDFDFYRFNGKGVRPSVVAEVVPVDLIRFGLIGYNSYDGSRAVSVGMYAEHLVCSNGMTSELRNPLSEVCTSSSARESFHRLVYCV